MILDSPTEGSYEGGVAHAHGTPVALREMATLSSQQGEHPKSDVSQVHQLTDS